MADDTHGGPNSLKMFWWIMGVIAMLLSAGVLAGVATYASVRSLDTNVSLLRDQFMREVDRQELRIQGLERKLDNYINYGTPRE